VLKCMMDSTCNLDSGIQLLQPFKPLVVGGLGNSNEMRVHIKIWPPRKATTGPDKHSNFPCKDFSPLRGYFVKVSKFDRTRLWRFNDVRPMI